MPELPEIETVKLGLEKTVVGSVLISTKIFRRDLRFPIDENIEKLISNKRVLAVGRRSKYVLIFLNNEITLVLHLGMSGKISVSIKNESYYQEKKHDHIIMEFDSGFILIYNDPRRFGFVEAIEGDHNNYRRFNSIGIEPLSKKFDGKYLCNKIKSSSRTLKNILMDQKMVAGLGNIYVSEALWDSQIIPTKVGKDLSLVDSKKLVRSIKKVLVRAIKFGGTTLKDYRQIGGEVGYFQNKLQVYGREGQKCCRRKCQGTVQRAVINGRSTFYCDFCQK
ncbi:bifunctional DNA-formamidopyrimidine glycosylase/DNA-(apurinic or apyrimidinic site) lyase [Paracoccaceae bacterium]|nr:bifunctional DNA-formamidopyrimidine glycosylase/DNA-(apurinic or apyrimidinic site) lyase [Paracoccaceae bacterium]